MRTLNLLALVGVIFFVGAWGMQWWRAPWSYPALGPTLTGTWEGPLRAGRGAEYRLYLDLQYRELRGRIYSPTNLTGQARLCTRTGEVYQFSLDGEASRSGDQIELRLASTDPARSDMGNYLAGRWDGQALIVRPHSNPFLPDGSLQPNRPRTSADAADSFEEGGLRKSDAATFLIACGRLTG